MKHIILVICLLLFLALTAFSQSPPVQSLKGLPGITVAMHKKYPEELEQDGLTMKQIATEVELRLRKAGIKVLTLDEAMKSAGSPVFEIEIGAVKSEMIYAISIRLKLEQDVITLRVPSTRTNVATWEIGNLIMVGRNNLRQVKDEVGDGVDVFANDFLTANPKPN